MTSESLLVSYTGLFADGDRFPSTMMSYLVQIILGEQTRGNETLLF